MVYVDAVGWEHEVRGRTVMSPSGARTEDTTYRQAELGPVSKPRVLVATFAYNEGEKIQETVRRMVEACDCDLLLVDDGSTDGSTERLKDQPIEVLRNEERGGIGAAMKRAFRYTLEGDYDILVIVAGNNKDDPREIPRLVRPIVADRYDFVQGSRFLEGGSHENMPLYRRVATRLHPPHVPRSPEAAVGEHQRLPGLPDGAPPRSADPMGGRVARSVRARALPALQGHPPGIPAYGGARDKELSAPGGGLYEDEADHGLVEHPPTHLPPWPGDQEVMHRAFVTFECSGIRVSSARIREREVSE